MNRPMRQQRHHPTRPQHGPRDYFNETVSLREYLEERIDALEVLMAARLDAMQVAIDKAEALLNARLLGMNEIREQLRTQRSEFATIERTDALRTLLDTSIDRVREDIKSLSESRAGQQGGQASMRELWGWIIGAAGVLVGLSRFIHP